MHFVWPERVFALPVAREGQENPEANGIQQGSALYVRVSTNEQADFGVSLEAQVQRFEAYCIASGLELMAISREEGVSGSVPLYKLRQFGLPTEENFELTSRILHYERQSPRLCPFSWGNCVRGQLPSVTEDS